MGKYGRDKRKYQKAWENTVWGKGWVQHISVAKNVDPNDPNEAHCKLCNVSLRSHIADLKKHMGTAKHRSKASMLSQPRKNLLVAHGYGIQNIAEKKKSEIQLALHVVMHSAIQSIDHLSDLVSALGSGSKLENVKLHRTKCSNIIKHVIAPVLLTDLIKAIGDDAYSIIIDESTDVSVMKYLCMCIRYFDVTENRIITTFLGILEVERATADDLHKSIVEYFQKIQLPLKNLTAIGTDGGSNLCGCNHSVFTLLREKIPHLQLLRCTCHSLHLCASKASEELPSSLDFLAREVFNWFSVSSLRRINYRKTFELLNSGHDGGKCRQMVQLSRTRWLAFYDVVKRLLEQWLELKTHFKIACDAERCYTARTIRDMLEDDVNRLYLLFLKPVLAEIQHLNFSFQSEDVDVGSLYEEMMLIFMSFSQRILKPEFLLAAKESNTNPLLRVRNALKNDLAFLPIVKIDFGSEFEKNFAESAITTVAKVQTKERCFNFLRRLLQEMSQRLPTNIDIFKSYRLLNPTVFLADRPEVKISFKDLPIGQFRDPHIDMAEYQSQWEKLTFVDWKAHFGGKMPSNILSYWPVVYQYTDACGRPVFRELARVILKMLVIPTSNAVVERAFSALTLIKTRIRNRMRTPMLEALLRIRLSFKAHGKCCKSFDPPMEMITRFNSTEMYPSSTETSAKSSDEDNETQDAVDEVLGIFTELELENF